MQQPDGTLVNAAGYALKGYPVGTKAPISS